MKATILNIGDELLIGQVVNTNASTMAKLLTEAGMEVVRTLVVGDNRDEIWKAVDEGMKTSDAVLVTGGLGPTKDDITKHLLCEYFGSELVESQVALDNVRRIFAARGYELTPINRAQALVPRCCEVLNNDLGTAPGMWIPSTETTGTVLVSLPGVPFEMEWLMRNRVIPKLQEHFQTGRIVTKNILVQGIGESFLSDLIEPWELSLPENIRLAYLPVAGMVKLRLTERVAPMTHSSVSRADSSPNLGEQPKMQLASDCGSHSSPKLGEVAQRAGGVCQSETAIPSLLHGLYALAGKYIVGEDCETLAELVHKTLTERGKTLATAESCTGGTIASRLTALAGASAYFRGGVVAYSNEVKECALGVKHETLAAHGAVSEETAREMAEGVRQRLGADYAIATTGIAGPGGGTPEKPVGTVWVAVSTPEHTVAQLMHYGDRRQQTIDRTVNQAFAMLVKELKIEN